MKTEWMLLILFASYGTKSEYELGRASASYQIINFIVYRLFVCKHTSLCLQTLYTEGLLFATLLANYLFQNSVMSQ